MHVRTTMTRDVLFVAPEDSLAEAYELMRENRIRHLAVVEDNRLAGVLSEKDVFLFSEVDGDRMHVREFAVADAMTEDVLTCRPGTTVGDAAALMIEKQINCLPVTTADGALVGMITSSDLLDLLRMREERIASEEIPFAFRIKALPIASKDMCRKVFTI